MFTVVSSPVAGPDVRRRSGAGVYIVLISLLTALTLGWMGAGSAQAHDTLLESNPEDGATGPAPEQIELTYSANVLEVGAAIRVTGPDGEVPESEITIDGPVVSTPLPADLGNGEYTVRWQVTSSDGHPISGEFAFTVEGEEDEPEQPGGDLVATDPAATEDEATEDEPADDQATEDAATETDDDTAGTDDEQAGSSDDEADSETGQATDAPEQDDTPAPSAAGDSSSGSGLPTWAWVVAALAVIGLAGWVITVARRSNSTA